MRTLLIDIETRPNLAHVWGLWDQNVGLNQLLESAEMICFAAKWLGAPKRNVYYASTFEGTRREMVGSAWVLLNAADVVIHYNGTRFDIPHLNREFLEHDIEPPSPFHQVDLLNTVRRQFRFPSNKLAYVSAQLGIGSKVKHEGHELWTKCMEGDELAWKRMKRYNIQDVLLLERLYERLKPWIANHPSLAAQRGENCCPLCGSSALRARGYRYTQVSRYPRYQCQSCRKWSRGTKRDQSTQIRAA